VADVVWMPHTQTGPKDATLATLLKHGTSPESAMAAVAAATDGHDPVVLAYVCSNEVAYSWHRSLVQMMAFDDNLHGRMKDANGGGFLAIRHGTGGITEARNQAVHQFLDEFPDAQWLFWLDTDMGFAPDTLEQLLAAADPHERPIVGALCFSQHESGTDGWGGWHTQATPTIYDWITVGDESGYAVRWDYPRDTVTPCHATGSACIVIHRSVLERMRDGFVDGTIRPAWYDRLPNPSMGSLLSEDLSFCARAGALDIPVHVHTGVRTTHYKRVWVGEEQYLRERVVLHVVDQPTGSKLATHIDIPASLETLERNEHVHDDMLKLPQDLDRYTNIIDATKPEVIVETGTRTGASAAWFADLGVDVVTVDIDPQVPGSAQDDRVAYVFGDSADPDIAAKVAEFVNGRRCMVTLDSDHSGEHVAKEIELYGPLVSPGCYLVVEDGIFGYATRTLRTAHGLGDMVGSPLDAIEKHLDANPDWSRDVAIERLSPVSHHPSGWWVRNG